MKNSSARFGSAIVALGGALAGLAFFSLLFVWAGGVTPYDLFTLAQKSNLELEEIFVFPAYYAALVLGGAIALGLVLRRAGKKGAGQTSLVYIVLTSVVISLTGSIVPTGPEDPLILPYLNLAAVALCGLVARSIVVALEGDAPRKSGSLDTSA